MPSIVSDSPIHSQISKPNFNWVNHQDVKITNAHPADLDALFALEQLCFEAHNFPLSRRQFYHFLNYGRVLFLVVKIKDQLVGYALFLLRKNSSATHLYSIAVHPEYRCLNLGKRLMEQALVKLRDMKLQKIGLEVRIDNQPALLFYRKTGFVSVARYVGYYSDGADAFRMEMSTNISNAILA